MSVPLDGVPTGTRVVVRHLIEGGERATDVVGVLTARDAASLTVEGRAGPVRVEVGDVVVAKVVPPVGPRWRIASFLRRAGVAVLDVDGLRRTVGSAPDPGAAAGVVVELVDRLGAGGVPVVVLARGAAGEAAVHEELGTLGLGRLAPYLLHLEGSPAGSGPEAMARAHGEIERRLGRTVGRGTVHLTDDRPGHVEAARAFGWQARVLTLP